MNQPSTTPQPSTPQAPRRDGPPRKSSGGWLMLILVTLVMFGLFIGTIIMLGWVYKDRMIASVVNLGIHTALTELPLPDEQKKDIIHQTDRLYEAFLDKRITVEELGNAAEKLIQGPALLVGAAYYAVDHQIEISDRTDEQKRDAKILVGRMTQAGLAQKFAPDALKPIADILKAENDPDQPQASEKQSQLKEKLTAAELDEVLGLCKKLADDANIPASDTPYVFDPSEHIRKVIDEILGSEKNDAKSNLPQ
jgi:hypothetical protein